MELILIVVASSCYMYWPLTYSHKRILLLIISTIKVWWHCRVDDIQCIILDCIILKASDQTNSPCSRSSTSLSKRSAQTISLTVRDLRALMRSSSLVLFWLIQNVNISLRLMIWALLLLENFPSISCSLSVGTLSWIPISNHLFRTSLNSSRTLAKLESVSMPFCSSAE